MIDKKTVHSLNVIWNYMVLNMPIQKADLIIGCGCSNLEVPKKCVDLYKQGYADKILFAGGLGKLTNVKFVKAEAEIYTDIALENGVDINNIFIENKSTNTGDNFRYSLKVIEENNIKADKILIVHNKMSERRTLSSAKAILKAKDLSITSPNMNFDEFITKLENKTDEEVKNIISVIVGDIQRIIIFPQLGWQIENDVPTEVIDSYYFLKNRGFDKYIFNKEQIQELINQYVLIEEIEANYFN